MNYTKQQLFSKLKTITAIAASFFIFVSGAFCETSLSEKDTEIINLISDFRMKLNQNTEGSKAVSEIEEMEKYLNSEEISSGLSAEILLSMNNILVWEKYNYLYEDDIACPLLEPLIKGQYEKVKKFFKEHKKEAHSKWLYTTSGDILSCCMQFLSIPTAMNEGLTIKKYYDSGLDEDPDFVWCLINIAQWYFYAPVINGGGKGKAQKTFEHAVESAVTPSEIFHAKLLLSQDFFEEKDFEKCTQLLDECEGILPGSRKVSFYRRINKIGHSYFDYTVNRKKVDKKLLKAESAQ